MPKNTIELTHNNNNQALIPGVLISQHDVSTSDLVDTCIQTLYVCEAVLHLVPTTLYGYRLHTICHIV